MSEQPKCSYGGRLIIRRFGDRAAVRCRKCKAEMIVAMEKTDDQD